MTKKTVTDVVSAIVEELTPLSSEERQRVIQASMTLLGEHFANAGKGGGAQTHTSGDANDNHLPHRARTWMQQNGLTNDDLHQVFHLSGEGVEVIAAGIPGKGRSEQVRNAYLLSGAARLLASGEPTFDDKAARALCESLGCYDSTNHAKYLKERGNEFTGSKDGGWTLTAPGLKRAAALVKELSTHG